MTRAIYTKPQRMALAKALGKAAQDIFGCAPIAFEHVSNRVDHEVRRVDEHERPLFVDALHGPCRLSFEIGKRWPMAFFRYDDPEQAGPRPLTSEQREHARSVGGNPHSGKMNWIGGDAGTPIEQQVASFVQHACRIRWNTYAPPNKEL